MNRMITAFIAAALLTAPGILSAASANEVSLIDDRDDGQKVTLGSATQLVTRYLKERGMLGQYRVGQAQMQQDGNVLVEIVNFQGSPANEIIVDGQTGKLADAATHEPLPSKG